MPPHDRQVVLLTLPLSCFQGRLTHTSANRATSTVLHRRGGGPGFLGAEVGEGRNWFNASLNMSHEYQQTKAAAEPQTQLWPLAAAQTQTTHMWKTELIGPHKLIGIVTVRRYGLVGVGLILL